MLNVLITTLPLQGQEIFTVAQNYGHHKQIYLFEWKRKLETAVYYRMLFNTEILSLLKFPKPKNACIRAYTDLVFLVSQHYSSTQKTLSVQVIKMCVFISNFPTKDHPFIVGRVEKQAEVV